MINNLTYSHESILRRLKAEQEVLPLISAYTYAFNKVANTNLEPVIISFDKYVQVKMSEPQYQFTRHTAEFSKIQKKFEKDITELSCSLWDSGYNINGSTAYGLSAKELEADILKRVEKLGDDFKTHYLSYLESHTDTAPESRNYLASQRPPFSDKVDLSKWSGEKGLLGLFNKKSAPSDNWYTETLQLVLPLYEAYLYASNFEDKKLDRVHVVQTKNDVTISISLLDKRFKNIMQLTRTKDGFKQNQKSDLNGKKISKKDNVSMSLSDVVKAFDKLVSTKDRAFKENYSRYLETAGQPHLAKTDKPAKKSALGLR